MLGNHIQEFSLESDTFALLAAWLALYFDGGSHIIGAAQPIIFPKAVIAFGQSPVPQPMNPSATPQKPVPPVPMASINIVWSSPLSTCRKWETVNGVVQQRAYKKIRLNCWVRAEMQSGTEMSARKLCRQTAERLSGLLGNAAATFALAECGIHRCRPNEPEMVSDTGYILMLVGLRATLRYVVNSQAQ